MKKLVHLFKTKDEIKEFISEINSGEGIPKYPDSITTTYCEFETSDSGFYVIPDEVTTKYSSELTEIEIVPPQPQENNEE
jgi:hypothetical protein